MGDAPYRTAKSLTDVVKDSYDNSAAHGFWDNERTDETLPSKLALIHSEVSEALESYRNPDSDKMVPVPTALVERLLNIEPVELDDDDDDPLSDLNSLYGKWQAKPKGLDIELADIVIRVGDLAGALGIDLDAAVQRKHAYNVGRPHKHGRIV